MNCLGIRCSTKEYSYVVLSGSREHPVVEAKERVKFPEEFSKAHRLQWFIKELEDINKKYGIDSIAIKETEASARRGKYFRPRVEVEAIIYLFAANVGISDISLKVNATIAKDLCLKGIAKLLSTELDCSPIAGYKEMSASLKDAVLVAWSTLK